MGKKREKRKREHAREIRETCRGSHSPRRSNAFEHPVRIVIEFFSKKGGIKEEKRKWERKKAVSSFTRTSELPQFMNVEVFLSGLIRKHSRHVPLIRTNKKAAWDIFLPSFVLLEITNTF